MTAETGGGEGHETEDGVQSPGRARAPFAVCNATVLPLSVSSCVFKPSTQAGRSKACAAVCVTRELLRQTRCGTFKPQSRHATHLSDLPALRSVLSTLLYASRLSQCVPGYPDTGISYDSVHLQAGLDGRSQHLTGVMLWPQATPVPLN